MFTLSNILMHLCTRDLCFCKMFPTSFSYTRLFHIAPFKTSGKRDIAFYTGVIQLIPQVVCAVVRDVTAYIAVVRVFRFPSEYYGCRYHKCPCFSVHRAKISSLFSAIITENCQEGIYLYFQRVSNFLNI